jgi:hypothetical protein
MEFGNYSKVVMKFYQEGQCNPEKMRFFPLGDIWNLKEIG